MMKINIISNSLLRNMKGGPTKVVNNTLIGLDKIGQKYVLNEPIENHKLNWIHDSIDAFIQASVRNIPVVAGPNLFTLPNDIPFFLPTLKNFTLLFPSKWTIDVWRERGFNKCSMEIWPAGINVEKYISTNQSTRNTILIYFKKRNPELLEKTILFVKKLGLDYNVIKYGHYQEQEYLDILKRSICGIWIGTTESQGIGLLEALAADVPLLVLDSSNILDHETPEIVDLPKDLADFKATTVPYFDYRCGMVVSSIDELEASLANFINNVTQYKPSEYIKEHLTLEKSAQSLVSIFQRISTDKFDKLEKGNEFFIKTNISFIKKLQFTRRQFIKVRRKVKNALR